MALERNQIKPPVLQKQSVQVDALGGEVVVRGLLLSERLELSALNGHVSQPKAGEGDDQARARGGAVMVAHTLARTVLLADGLPAYTAQEWDEFGATHPDAVLELFKVSRRMGGQDLEDVEKN